MKIDAAAFRRLAPAEQLAQIRGSHAEREFRVDRGAIDEKRRTAWLSIASEQPYERWWGVEILAISDEAINAERLKAGAALLVNHDASDHVGIVDDYQITGGKLRVQARFGRGARADEVWRDVLDGIRVSTSVGYQIDELELVRKEGDINHYRVTLWTPFEGSLVSVPADSTVGVARGHEKKRNTMKKEDGRTEYPSRGAQRFAQRQLVEQALGVVPAEDRLAFRGHLAQLAAGADAAEADVLSEIGDLTVAYSLWRSDTIRALGAMWPQYGGPELAKRAELDHDMTVDAVRRSLLKAVHLKRPGEEDDVNTNELGADRHAYGDAARVSHGRPLQHFKGPNAEREAYAVGMQFKALCGDTKAKRVMTEGVYGVGGAWETGAGPLATAVISNVVEQYGIARRFATVWPMDASSLNVPTNGEGLTIAGVGENVATPTSDLSTGAVALTAKEFAGGTRISRSLLDDSPIALGDFVTGELARGVAKLEDQAVFIADGTSTYSGITGILWRAENQAGFAGAKYQAATGHDTFAEIDLLDLTGAMAKLPEYARKNARWWCSASAKDAILTRLAAAAGGNNTQSIQGGIGEAFLGYQVITTPVAPSDTAATYNVKPILAFGDLRLATAFGDRRSLEVTIDMSRFVEFRQAYVAVTSRFDVNNHLRGTTASVCGPMVVLFGKT